MSPETLFRVYIAVIHDPDFKAREVILMLKTKFLHMLVKLVLISDTYCIFIVCYTPIATFQKADTCLDAQQSMAKQPIKG